MLYKRWMILCPTLTASNESSGRIQFTLTLAASRAAETPPVRRDYRDLDTTSILLVDRHCDDWLGSGSCCTLGLLDGDLSISNIAITPWHKPFSGTHFGAKPQWRTSRTCGSNISFVIIYWMAKKAPTSFNRRTGQSSAMSLG
ncbi:uncharacterized protein ARMOST_01711 [Armillaria ostoyae]|uniref:Uncharacterized protein n=1 Tax=Armillaria ostoyae TaxID=47428 RepID=A0A284QPR6_ARMOS|nr:uncharacterized protein ARMOST_01711 [Armillaria ostoyae]